MVEDSFKLLEEKIKKAGERLRRLAAENQALKADVSRAQSGVQEALKRVEAAEKQREAADRERARLAKQVQEAGRGPDPEVAERLESLDRDVKQLRNEREAIRDRLAKLVTTLEGLE
jgi:chromosome segregation ATPase